MTTILATMWRHKLLAIGLPFAVIAGGTATAWALAYDNHNSKRLLPGTVIEGVPVGGMHHQAAARRLRQRLEAPLHRPIKVSAERFESQTSAWDLGYRIDVDRAVKRALRESNSGTIVTRLWRRMFHSGAPGPITLRPEWSSGGIDGLLGHAAEAVSEAPRDADIDISTGWVQLRPAQAGRTLEAEPSRKVLVDAVAGSDDSVRLVTRPTPPAEMLTYVILVRAGENRLYLYQDGNIVKSWPVATGSGRYPTPTGVWRVVNKQVNPVWINPGSAWARSMPARIPPGPRNPLGTHAMGLNATGILIHATSDSGSIGYSVSHGCIRMTEADELELFNIVPVGTRVAVVQAEPPKPRPANPPPAATPTTFAPNPVELAAREF